MKLEDYLHEVGIPITVFARKVGVSLGTIHNILKSERDIRLSVAARIEKITDYKVTCRELLCEKLLNKFYEKKSRKKEYKKHSEKPQKSSSTHEVPEL